VTGSVWMSLRNRARTAARAMTAVAATTAVAAMTQQAFADTATAAGPVVSPPPPSTSPITTELATYHGNLGRQGYTPAETTIKVSNVGTLQALFTYQAPNAISGQAAVTGGIAYWGDWSGDEHATSATGKNLWTTYLGRTSAPGCNPSPVGIASSATVGTLNGMEVVVTGGGAGNVVELNAATGKILWDVRIAPKVAGFVWSSPALYDGSVYIGMSSFGDCPLVASSVVMLNAQTGAVEHTFSTVPAGGCLGDGVWSSPAIDPAENAVFVTTGNATCTTPLQDAMLKLSATDLTLESSWAVPVSQRVDDSDWGSSVTLFTAEIGGQLEQLAGSSDKNGIFYALSTADLGRGPVWEYRVAEGGDCPQCGNGSISPASWDGTTLYVAGGSTTVGTTSCPGSVDALDPATGQPLWRDCVLGGPVLGALTEVPGLLFATEGPDLVALETHNGARRFIFRDTSAGVFYGPATVGGGVLWAGDTAGNLFAWALPQTPARLPRA